jgi:hypothetical protein
MNRELSVILNDFSPRMLRTSHQATDTLRIQFAQEMLRKLRLTRVRHASFANLRERLSLLSPYDMMIAEKSSTHNLAIHERS